jgi:dihydrofolate reductase
MITNTNLKQQIKIKMRRLVLFMHVSVDGFVAGPNGEMDWIHVDEDMFEYAGQQTDEADTALYGRVTYQMMDSYWPTAADQPNATKHDIQHSKWYNNVDKIVLSRTMQEGSSNKVMLVHDNLQNEIVKRKQQDGKNIVIFGSPSVAHLMMHHNLIDDYWLFVNPVILGKGIPLFKDVQERLKFKLIWNKVFSSKAVGLHYERELE